MKKRVIKPKNQIEIVKFFKGLSPQRVEILCAIKRFNPDSIYELALKLKKSQPYLQKEIQFLAQKGLLELKKTKINGRKKVTPEMNYQVLSFEVDFTDVELS